MKEDVLMSLKPVYRKNAKKLLKKKKVIKTYNKQQKVLVPKKKLDETKEIFRERIQSFDQSEEIKVNTTNKPKKIRNKISIKKK